MKLVAEVLRYSATDLANFLACRHLTRLDLAAVGGLATAPVFHDLGVEALARRGEEHEARVLADFEGQGWKIERIPKEGADIPARAEATEGALASDVDVIYQGVLSREKRLGLPDFLIRADLLRKVDGPVGYEVCDAKLARSAKAKAVLQSTFYSRLLFEISGIEPQNVHLELGNRERATFRVKDYAAYERQVDRLFQDFIVEEPVFPPNDTYPEPVEQCAVCRWRSACVQRRRDDDDLSLIAGMTTKQRKGLKKMEISTRRGFAGLNEPPKIERVGSKALAKSHRQAQIQVRGEDQDEPLWEFLEPERDQDGDLVPDRGLLALPEPAEGDLFFDIEGARYYSEDGKEFGLQYLFGIVDSADLDQAGKPRYHAFWAFDRAGEREAFKKVIDFIAERLERHPGAHVYHYNHYEPTALDRLAELHVTREDVVRRLMGRFATKEDEVDNLLRRRIFVDLYRVVRQGLLASVESYSIKRLERFYGFERTVELPDVNERVVAFDLSLDLGEAEGDLETRDILHGYNEDDCRSTLELRTWLEARREDLGRHLGVEVPRPVPPEVPEDRTDPEVKRLREALLDGVPDEDRSEVEEARALLADLLEFHRRDDKPKWWRYYHLRELKAEELLEEAGGIAGLEFVGTGDRIRNSTLYLYRFPPQEHGFKPGDSVEDPLNDEKWKIEDIDDATGVLSIPRSRQREDRPHPFTLLEGRPEYGRETHKKSLLDLADRTLAAGGSWPTSAAFDLLLRRRPNDGGSSQHPLRRAGEDALDAGRRLAMEVTDSYLPIQGPPGTGKTYTAACQIVDLVRARRKVGVTAMSHSVICNVLDELALVADREDVEIRIGQKPDSEKKFVNDQASDAGLIFSSNQAIRAAFDSNEVDVVGATTWAWTHPLMEAALDVLVVDEAGQMSLADVLACTRSARTVILLGDPMQLRQPSQGAHPPGADATALEHVLGETETMPEHLGVFIEKTRRMHPDIYAFTSEIFYGGRLTGIDGLELQHISGVGGLSGSGLRLADVEHEGNTNASPEEAVFVVSAIQDLLERTWIDRGGREREIAPQDILIVTPFNAHIHDIDFALKDASLTGVRVGTVDKFQGQQAPVAIYSMASSSVEEAPRGMEFLYSLNRLNVATSRAQCVAVVVTSPRLGEVLGSTPRQMHLANALCRFRELGVQVPERG